MGIGHRGGVLALLAVIVKFVGNYSINTGNNSNNGGNNNHGHSHNLCEILL